MKPMHNTKTDIDPQSLSTTENYKLLIGSVVPRPIAWVSTCSKDGVSNLAPYSFFNAVTSSPPTIVFCPVDPPAALKKTEKDTLRNIRETKVFGINIASYSLLDKLNATAENFPYGVSEFEKIGIRSVPGQNIAVALVDDALIQFECKLNQIIKVGNGNLVIGEIVRYHFDPRVLNADHKIDLDLLDPVGRLAGEKYCLTRETVELKRPQ
jgi:flavin reductase (DIM6/NTAB) family NADH-FMN oxidoreductase RutF